MVVLFKYKYRVKNEAFFFYSSLYLAQQLPKMEWENSKHVHHFEFSHLFAEKYFCFSLQNFFTDLVPATPKREFLTFSLAVHCPGILFNCYKMM